MEEFGARPGYINFTAYQGDSFYKKINIASEDDTPLDLTNMDIEFSIAVARGGRPAYQYSTADYVSVGNPTSGTFEINVPDRETKRWNLGRYAYEITVSDGLGYAKTFLTGNLRVMNEVVR